MIEGLSFVVDSRYVVLRLTFILAQDLSERF